jgi:hypothetical protein
VSGFSLRRLLFDHGMKWPALQSRLWRSVIQVQWKKIEYFDESWKARIGLMAGFIPPASSVLDLGCGKEWLVDYVGRDRYTGVDYKARSAQTIVCDFNRRQFPSVHRDVAFVSGCLEYVEEPAWFIQRICEACDRCIVSYCAFDTHPDTFSRRTAGWVNDLTLRELIHEFEINGFVLDSETETPTRNSVLVFDRKTGGLNPALKTPAGNLHA